MATNWSTAAKNIRVARIAEHGVFTNQNQRPAFAQRDTEKDRALAQQEEEIDLATRELEQFMRTEGHAAIDLLDASKKHIIFGEEYEGGGFGVVFVIDGIGLRKSVEAMGMWTAYSKDIPSPKITPITPREAIEAAVRFNNKKATEVVEWLRGQLDAIAATAPAVN